MKETLVILTPGFPASEADSTCLPPQQVFVRSLKEQYPQLDLLILSFQYPYQPATYTWHGIPVIGFGGKNKGGLSRRLLWLQVKKKLGEIHKEKKIKAILSFWCGECALIGKRFAVKHQLHHFCWILGQDAKKDNRFVKKISPQPDELIALSDFIQDEFERNHGIRPQYVVPPGIDRRLFSSIGGNRSIDLLAAGSLIPLKQYGLFIEVVAALKKEYPGIRAILVGNGPEKKKLQELVRHHQVENNIALTGELPHQEVLQMMQQSKIFLHPSAYEGFGVVCIEALYAGASVISFCNPMKEEIENWQIATGLKDMIEKSSELLKNHGAYAPVLFNPIEDTVRLMMSVLE